MTKRDEDKLVAARRDAAVRRALSTPPTPLKDMKKAKAKKKRQDTPTASEKRT